MSVAVSSAAASPPISKLNVERRFVPGEVPTSREDRRAWVWVARDDTGGFEGTGGAAIFDA